MFREKESKTYSKTKAGSISPVPASKNIPGKFKLDRKDIIIMLSMTIIYLIAALVNLGSLNVPQTVWNPAKPGENVVIDLGREADLSRITYFCALGTGWSAKGSYRVEYLDANGDFVPLTTLNKDNVFVWKTVNVSVKTSRLKIIVDTPGGALNEAGIFESGSSNPLKGIKIVEKNIDPSDGGSVENLFDEQDKVAWKASYLNGTYFDEIYHARTAYEHLHKIEPFENTHPPLGKVFISLGIAIFGMTPFGWRIIGTLFGAAMIPLMYAFGKKMFHKRLYAFSAAFLMMFDFMHFAQTRISTIDVYVTFFVILMFYHMYDYFINKSYNLGFKESLKPLFLSGLFFGFGAASKWIALYGAAGLAFLFFLTKILEYTDYKKLMGKGPKKSRKIQWLHNFIPQYMGGTFAACVLFFVIIPGVIYILSYIPFMMVPGPGHGLKEVFTLQQHMYNYHSTLKAGHPFTSPWWEWPLMVKPIWFYGGSELPAGKASTIASFGNPAIWWVGIVAMVLAVLTAIRLKDKKMIVIFMAIASQYLPWALVPRIAFIYHYFSIVPFVILSIVYVMKDLIDSYPRARYAFYAYLAITAVLFIWFYPVLSGMEVNRSYIDGLKWLKTWNF
jgi:dolichyl-phosphate-mannose-protein mannosyltransferase